jgi:hypothetical protein
VEEAEALLQIVAAEAIMSVVEDLMIVGGGIVLAAAEVVGMQVFRATGNMEMMAVCSTMRVVKITPLP